MQKAQTQPQNIALNWKRPWPSTRLHFLLYMHSLSTQFQPRFVPCTKPTQTVSIYSTKRPKCTLCNNDDHNGHKMVYRLCYCRCVAQNCPVKYILLNGVHWKRQPFFLESECGRSPWESCSRKKGSLWITFECGAFYEIFSKRGAFCEIPLNFAKTARPLHRLTKPSVKFTWSATEQLAFDNLKTALDSAPLRHFPNPHAPFALHTDASKIALGAILCQQDNDLDFVVNYSSRLTNKHEANYSAIELECLAIVWE